MSDPINDLIEGVWEAHGDSEAWVKLANAAQSQNQALQEALTKIAWLKFPDGSTVAQNTAIAALSPTQETDPE